MVPGIDRSTGEPYTLRLAMEGCRMDRLNSGAPVFDISPATTKPARVCYDGMTAAVLD